MSTTIQSTPAATARPDRPDPRRWKALAVLGLIQFMLVLDITVVNVALPHIQHDLSFSRAGLAWVVNGYVLMSGGFLLLGGRMADILGRRRVFLLGVGLFAAASASCGAAVDPAMLVASRFVQGLGEALAGLGGTSGTVISGALTGLASWRWIFLINLPVALIALIAVPRLVSEGRMVRAHNRPGVAGAVAGTAGLIAIVDGLLAAASHPWGSWQVLVPLLGGVGLAGLMVWIEARSRAPLIPLSFFSNRTRVVTNFVTLFSSAAFFSYFFCLTLFEQQVRGYSPLTGGLSYLPFGLSIGAGMGLSTAVMPRIGVKPLLSAGYLGSALGLFLASGIDLHSSYTSSILPGMVVLGFCSGITFPAIGNTALQEVTGQDASLASAVQTAMQAIGGAIGLACLVTLALRHAAGQVRDDVPAAVAATHGYVLAFRLGAALTAIGGVLVLALFARVNAQARNPLVESSSHPPEQPAADLAAAQRA